MGLNCVQDEDDGPANILDDDLQQQLNEMADYNSDEDEARQPGSSHAGTGAHQSAQYSGSSTLQCCPVHVISVTT